MSATPNAAATRPADLRRALGLEVLTVGWNVVEGLVAVFAAAAAGSVALLAFGVDSFVEMASGLVLVWRLRAERGAADRAAIERLDRRAHRLVGLSLFALALYVAADAGLSLWRREEPGTSLVGIVLTTISIFVMLWLAGAKRRLAARLESRALEADAFQTTACFWLSVFALGGLTLNALFGWWWADPLAALVMCGPIVTEGIEGWRGGRCGC